MSGAVPCRVILLGMMGSGKTTVGQALASRTGWPYRDNDELLGAATGRTARQLAEDGRDALRRAEAAALQHALRTPVPCIVAAAAGTVIDSDLRRAMRRAGLVVWLRARPEVLARRSTEPGHRPWLDADAAEWLTKTAERRAPLYDEVASLAVDTEAADPDGTARIILARLRLTSCAKWLGTPLAVEDGHD